MDPELQARLDGKVAIITGASRGIGLSLAEAFLKAGCSVMITARNLERLRTVQKVLGQVSSRVEAASCDVTLPEQVDGLIQAAVSRFGTVDILINNAGILGAMGPSWQNSPEQWEETIRVNLVGTYLCCRAVLPIMIERRRGKIINLSGRGAAYPWPQFTAYSASKAAVVRFTETLAEETKGYNIQVNVMAPGANDTDLLKTAAQLEPSLLNDLPEDRLKPSRLALFLASEASDHITGRFIHVNQEWDRWTSADLVGDRFTLRRV